MVVRAEVARVTLLDRLRSPEPWRSRSVSKALERISALLFVLTAAAAVIVGGSSTLLVLLVLAALVAGTSWWLVDREEAALVARLILVVFLVRCLATTALHVFLLPSGAMFQDDGTYLSWPDAIARGWRGEAVTLPSEEELRPNNYIFFVAGLFWSIGPNALALKLINTSAGILVAILGYRCSLALVGRAGARVALVALLVFPSLALWSSLALKDSVVLLLGMGASCAIVQFMRRPNLWLTVAAVLMLLLLQGTRAYFYVILTLAWIGALVLLIIGGRRSASVYVSLGIAALVLVTGPRGKLSIGDLASLESAREEMAVGARTAFVPVTTPTESFAAASPTAAPTTAPPPPTPTPSFAAASPTAEEGPPSSFDIGQALRRNLAFLPIGLLYLLAAPFPWELTRGELPIAAELLVWYPTLAFALFGVLRMVVGRSWEASYVVLVILGLSVSMSLLEGNVGTLIRHRSMLIPFAVIAATVAVTYLTSPRRSSTAVAVRRSASGRL